MKIMKFRCDACATENDMDSMIRLKLPIMIAENNLNIPNFKTMTTKKMDICIECAKEIMNKYYEIGKRNNFSGMIAVSLYDGECDE